MHKGIAVSPGVVVGVAYRVESVFGSIEPQTLDGPGQVPAEIAVSTVRSRRPRPNWRASSSRSPRNSGASAADIFKSHLQIVNDQALLAKVHALIETAAPDRPVGPAGGPQGYAARFARIEQDYFRERMADVRDVISRIGSHLTLARPSPSPTGADGVAATARSR